MPPFTAATELEVMVSDQSIRSARRQIERDLGDVTVGVSTPTGVTDGGRESGASKRMLELDEERNDLLEELAESTLATGGGGGGGTTIIPAGIPSGQLSRLGRISARLAALVPVVAAIAIANEGVNRFQAVAGSGTTTRNLPRFQDESRAVSDVSPDEAEVLRRRAMEDLGFEPGGGEPFHEPANIGEGIQGALQDVFGGLSFENTFNNQLNFDFSNSQLGPDEDQVTNIIEDIGSRQAQQFFDQIQSEFDVNNPRTSGGE